MTPEALAELDKLSDDEIREKYPPDYIGPTWQKDDDGDFILPERTLGWEIVEWCAEWLHSLEDGAEEGDPLILTLEQLRFVLWWYALDENGNFAYRQGVLQRLKGWGKDPLLAVLSIVEFVGPAQFSHWGPDGEPVGKQYPRAFVQIAAVNQEQTSSTMDMVDVLVTDRLIAHFGIEPGRELYRARGSRKLQAVTSSPRALEGKRSTFVVLNETHHWLESNNGHSMYYTARRNTRKMGGRLLAITNAYLPGEESVAQKMRENYENILEGRVHDTGWLYDSIEAAPNTPITERALRAILPLIRGDAEWLNVDDVLSELLDETISIGLNRRFWLNQVVADDDALYSPEQWYAIATDEDFKPGDRIVLGFDGGKTDDATVLVAMRVKDSLVKVLGLWEKPEGPRGEHWQVNRDEVDSAVHDAFRVYDVAGFYADVALWESYIDSWTKTYGEQLDVKSTAHEPIAWDMRQSLKRVTLAHESLITTIFDGKIKINKAEPAMRRHFLNVRRRTNQFGVSFGKESRESKRKIDLYAGLLLAHVCLHDLNTKAKPKEQLTRRGWFL